MWQKYIACKVSFCDSLTFFKLETWWQIGNVGCRGHPFIPRGWRMFRFQARHHATNVVHRQWRARPLDQRVTSSLVVNEIYGGGVRQLCPVKIPNQQNSQQFDLTIFLLKSKRSPVLHQIVVDSPPMDSINPKAWYYDNCSPRSNVAFKRNICVNHCRPVTVQKSDLTRLHSTNDITGVATQTRNELSVR